MSTRNVSDPPSAAEAERFARVAALFDAALALPAAQREAFLAAQTGDEALRADVLRLIARDREHDATLRTAFAQATAGTERTASRIGPYHVLGELGAGGMGTVLLAEREFGDARQKVALKLIRGFPTAQARERLARERALLAGLNHPHIARLLDAGETADGVPYLAMEYVEGVSLGEYCARTPALAARLRLFATLCRAVQHAHQRLIVHRDIKPSNILVREDGTPVLLDFGIGKLLESTARDDTATRVFTPAYAAPEQIAGRGVTTATDVFGLGAVLHEMLSGRSLAEVRSEQRVPPPSAITDGTLPARVLRGELDTLTAKAMHEEPERRYASAQALASDVENFLAGRPLDAAPDSAAYRARKWLQRHRVAAFVAAAALLMIAVFVWRLNTERQHALAAEAHAQREAQSTRRSRDYLVSLFQSAAPSNSLGHSLSARELIDKGSERLAAELKDEPESAARVGATIAEVYGALGDPKAAIANGERALALADGETPERALLRADILLVLGAEYDNTERFDDARRADEQALALREKYAPDDRLRIAMTLTDLGNAAVRRGDDDPARRYFERAQAEFARLPDAPAVERANVLRGLADVDYDEGKSADSIAHAQQSLDLLAALPPQSPDRLEPWGSLARAQIAHGDAVAAVAVLERALGVARAALGAQSGKVANVENDLAVALNAQGRYRDAIAHLQQSIAIDSQLRPGEHVAIAFATINLGSFHENMGDYAQAETLMRQGIAAIEAQTPDEPQLDYFRGNLGRTLMLRGKLAEARALVEKAMQGLAARDGEKSFGYGLEVFRLARIELAEHALDAATRDLQRAEAIVDASLPPAHAMRTQIAVIRGMIARERGDLATAQDELTRAETMQLALKDADQVSLAVIRQRLAGVLLARGDVVGAKERLAFALPILEQALVPAALELVEARGYAKELEHVAGQR